MSDFLNPTIINLIAQQEANLNGNLADVELRNDLAVPETIPEENTQSVNAVEITYLEAGGNADVILQNYSQLLSIAHQCPYAGGPAVERARAFVALVNDSLEYFDDDICLQVGIYRETEELLFDNPINKFVEIVPNPTTDQFEVRLKSESIGICQIIIRNSLNKVTYTGNFECNDKIFLIEAHNWPSGIYFVWVMIDNSFVETKKLVILK